MRIFGRSMLMGMGIAVGMLVILGGVLSGAGLIQSRAEAERRTTDATATNVFTRLQATVQAERNAEYFRAVGTAEAQATLQAPPSAACRDAVARGLLCPTPLTR